MVRSECEDMVEQRAHLKVLLSGNLGRKNIALSSQNTPSKRTPPMITFDSKTELLRASVERNVRLVDFTMLDLIT